QAHHRRRQRRRRRAGLRHGAVVRFRHRGRQRTSVDDVYPPGPDSRRRRHVFPAAPGGPGARQGADLLRPARGGRRGAGAGHDRPRRHGRYAAGPGARLGGRAVARLADGAGAVQDHAEPDVRAERRAIVRHEQPGPGGLLHHDRTPRLGGGVPGQDRGQEVGKTMRQLDSLLRPRSVAVIGASSESAKTAGRPIAYLQKHGYAGRIYPVTPRSETIAGLPCYADVASLPEAPDVGLVLLGAARAAQAVRDLAGRGAGAAIVLASGFQETGAAGAERQRALREAAGDTPLLGPNTIGLVNLTDGITLSASGALEMDDLQRGSIAVVSQSGGVLGAMLSRAASRGIGFSKLVSTGNEADLDVADLVENLLDDPATAVIALYIEGLRKPAAFRAAAVRAARLGKPLVVFKVGRSESGARSAVSHTGALAGADRMYDALFAQCGVIRA